MHRRGHIHAALKIKMVLLEVQSLRVEWRKRRDPSVKLERAHSTRGAEEDDNLM